MIDPLTYREKRMLFKPPISAPNNTIRPHTCAKCGAYFEDRIPNSKWCPTCEKEARHESHNESARRGRARRAKVTPERLAALAKLKGTA